jgi:hypothetical protein
MTGAAPAWAVQQRRLLAAIKEAAPVFLEHHTLADGGLRRHGKLDDDFETFRDWTLAYAIGGERALFDHGRRCWEAITRHWTAKGHMNREFICAGHTDMLHLSEGYVGFQYFGLADPDDATNRERACRFASFYTGDDPAAPNYDREHRVLRSPFTGSTGPARSRADTTFTARTMLETEHQWASLYPVVKDREPDCESPEILELADRVITRSDVAMNLAVTGLVTNAYLYTGDDRYRSWVLEYVDAWMERTRANGGLIPDNVGPTGKIGEHRDGQWWGGFFGWTNIHAVEMISKAVITATECALVLTGDGGYLDFLRGLVDGFLERAVERDGELLVPHRMGPDGWYDLRRLDPAIVGHLWHASMDRQDEARYGRLRRGSVSRPRDDIAHANEHRDNDPPHLDYLMGLNPEWPAQVVEAEHTMVRRNLARIQGGIYESGSQTVVEQNPVLTNGLAQMTMGAPFTCYNGGLLRAHLRWFDADHRRPGLPADVAALVESVGVDHVAASLVNLSPVAKRQVIVQAGAYGEHEVTNVTVSRDETERREVKDRAFAVALPPATTTRLRIGLRRFVRRPSYAFPW